MLSHDWCGWGLLLLDSLDGDALDAFGKCLQQHNGKYPRGPGGAYIGFGLYGGGRLGIGLNAGWTQPNIDQRGGELILSAAATTKQAGGLFVNYRSAGKVWFRANGSIQRLPFIAMLKMSLSFICWMPQC